MIRLNIRIDTPDIEGKVMEATQKAQFALDQQVLKDSNFYIPKDTGELERSGVRFSRPGEGHIEWSTPYARRLYWNPQYSFSHDANPNAMGLWFEEAKARNVTDWVRIVENDIKRNL
ncbi:minor capsid protein [Bacillus pseudomycoides]|uniref:Minor capsid protein n=1 Tax=Bacillus pseudomycoides TaxID=64104 RepID=A0A2A8CAW9_9BACI|nr:minor capsid protein [Bacillus pseudomycoides]PEI42590.1 minor capsid protein [Bacillus pseudomycoides]PEJ75184.1 minor capsid protein [Bacillus pseudomycoides]PEM73258.1 minor capsid protein [Bacillus pseudomycoides]PFW67973.1 minor capsid protein [Bacillus pseudomycoides]PFW80008.1 minor capsid protein [Bacillus pseudomycoides]